MIKYVISFVENICGSYDTPLMYLIVYLLFILTSCNTSSHDTIMTSICGRDPSHPLIYRIKVPPTWEHHTPLPDESLADTTKALCEFVIDKQINITIHNFSSESIEQRIPSEAQISRWKRQFSNLDQNLTSTTPQAFSGFKGLLFEGSGILNGIPQSVMGWSMQIAPIHYRSLTHSQIPHFQEMRADITIKAVGPTSIIDHYRDEIFRFARSFELSEAIPSKT